MKALLVVLIGFAASHALANGPISEFDAGPINQELVLLEGIDETPKIETDSSVIKQIKSERYNEEVQMYFSEMTYRNEKNEATETEILKSCLECSGYDPKSSFHAAYIASIQKRIDEGKAAIMPSGPEACSVCQDGIKMDFNYSLYMDSLHDNQQITDEVYQKAKDLRHAQFAMDGRQRFVEQGRARFERIYNLRLPVSERHSPQVPRFDD